MLKKQQSDSRTSEQRQQSYNETTAKLQI